MSHHVVYGIHAVSALLTDSAATIDTLFVQNRRQDKRMQQLLALAKRKAIDVQFCDKEKLEHYAGVPSHQGVVALSQETMAPATENDVLEMIENLKEPVLLLILDGVQDPHNVGACLRTAVAAGVHAVIAPKDRASGLTPVVKKISCGASEKIPFLQVTNLARFMRQLQALGIWFVGADAHTDKTIYALDLTSSIAWVLGAEGAGLRHNTQKHCDELVKIPMSGEMDSLNVSVASGVCLFETVRQRGNLMHSRDPERAS